jgi:hypothetical protein
MICGPFKTYLNLVSDEMSVGSARLASITSMMICRSTFCVQQANNIFNTFNARHFVCWI